MIAWQAVLGAWPWAALMMFLAWAILGFLAG